MSEDTAYGLIYVSCGLFLLMITVKAVRTFRQGSHGIYAFFQREPPDWAPDWLAWAFQPLVKPSRPEAAVINVGLSLFGMVMSAASFFLAIRSFT
ncbi:MAG: hypothetical protein HY873_04510 [Chloroflexi bacterium]|nr:hypothetical protein [Chloroflexota bacterium]